MINAKELRIGNLVEYRITDKLDERKEWWEVSEIDADDIHWLSKVDTKDEDFRSIPLTEEWLLKLGFENTSNVFYYRYGFYSIFITKDNNGFHFQHEDGFTPIKNVHELQNLVYFLCYEELTVA